MIRSATKLLAALLLAASIVTAWGAPAISEVKIAWLKGFPQRVGNQTILMWTPAPGVARYQISRTEESSGQTVSWETSINNYMDTKADLEGNYLYQVKGLAPDGRVVGASLPARLEGYKKLDPPEWGGTYQSAGNVYLVWEGQEGAGYYNIYKSTGDVRAKIIGSTGLTNYVDSDVKTGQTYKYFLRAVDQSGNESKDSKILTITAEEFKKKVKEEIERRKLDVSRFVLAPEVKISEPTELLLKGGLIYLTDMGSRSVMVLSMDGKLLRRFAVKPPDYQGLWGVPWGIASDSAGRRFAVTFLQSPNVRVFDDTGALAQDIIVGPPPDVDPAKRLPAKPQPMDVAIEEQEGLWISEYTYGQIVFFDILGREAGRVGVPRVLKDAGPFKSPTFLMINPATRELNVVDSFQAKIFRLSLDGQVLGAWGNDVEGEGSLHLPKGLEMNEKGETLVIDGILSTLQAFDKSGKLIAVYEPRSKDDPPLPQGMVTCAVNKETGEIFVISKVENAIFRLKPVP